MTQSIERSKVFVLGDSRTGTTSLHKFFRDAGYNSIHYFIDEVNEIARARGAEGHDFESVKEFIENAGFNAFSDYPVRSYFRDLLAHYPTAHFILSTRKDVEAWAASMKRFFADREDVVSRLDYLKKVYLRINDEIRETYKDAENFIELCIDDDGDENSAKLREFLGAPSHVSLKQLNATVTKS